MHNEQYIKIATLVCCPLCDRELCIGRYDCPEIQEYIKNQKETSNGQD